MDFIDEQHVVGFQIGQDRRQVARTLQHRAGSLAQIDAHLARDNVRQRGFAQTRRAEQQRVIKRFAALPGGGDEDFQLAADLFLAHVFVQLLGAQCALHRLFMVRHRRGGDDALFGKTVSLNTHGILLPLG